MLGHLGELHPPQNLDPVRLSVDHQLPDRLGRPVGRLPNLAQQWPYLGLLLDDDHELLSALRLDLDQPQDSSRRGRA